MEAPRKILLPPLIGEENCGSLRRAFGGRLVFVPAGEARSADRIRGLVGDDALASIRAAGIKWIYVPRLGTESWGSSDRSLWSKESKAARNLAIVAEWSNGKEPIVIAVERGMGLSTVFKILRKHRGGECTKPVICSHKDLSINE